MEMKRLEPFIMPTRPARIAAKILGVATQPFPADFPSETFIPPYHLVRSVCVCSCAYVSVHVLCVYLAHTLSCVACVACECACVRMYV